MGTAVHFSKNPGTAKLCRDKNQKQTSLMQLLPAMDWVAVT